MNGRPPLPPSGRAGRALIWVAGANEQHIRVRKERVFFQVLGGSVVLTAAAAVMGMLAFQRLLVPGNWFRDIGLALLWGLFIFCLDRWVVSWVDYGRRAVEATHDGRKPRARRWSVSYASRMLLALVLAFVISGPIVLAVFEPEINQQLLINHTADRAAAGEQIRARPDFVQRAAAIDAALTIAEAQATQAPAAAAVARDQARRALATLDADIAAASASSDAGIAESIGVLARERALFDLLLSEPYLLLRWAALTALLILVDLVPSLLRWVGRGTTLHDHLVRAEIAAEMTAVRDARERAPARSTRLAVPSPLAERLVRRIVRVLPVTGRSRYREEFAVELDMLVEAGTPWRGQLAYVLRLALYMWSLRRALRKPPPAAERVT